MTKFFTFLFTLVIFSSCTISDGSDGADRNSSDKSTNAAANGEIKPTVPESGDYKLFPYWKKGDVRYVHQVLERSIVTSRTDDKEVALDFKYRFRVLEVDDFITVELYQRNLDLSKLTELPVEDEFDQVVKHIRIEGRKFMNGFPFILKIHKKTGDVIEVLNRDRFEKEFIALCDSIAQEKFDFGTSNDDKYLKVAQEFHREEAKDKISTIILVTNHLLQMYGIDCEVGGKKTKETVLNDEITSGMFSGGEMPTTLTVITEKERDDLLLDIEYSINSDDLLEVLDGKYLNIEEVGEEKLKMSHKQKLVFNTVSSWPEKLEMVLVMDATSSRNNEFMRIIETITTTFHTKNF